MTLEGAAAALALAPIAFARRIHPGPYRLRLGPGHHSLATFFVPLPFALAVFAIVDFANGLRLGLENRGTPSSATSRAWCR